MFVIFGLVFEMLCVDIMWEEVCLVIFNLFIFFIMWENIIWEVLVFYSNEIGFSGIMCDVVLLGLEL